MIASNRLFYFAALTVVVVIGLALAAPDPHSDAPASDAKELFNGKDLSGWDGDAQVWSVQDGVITGHATKAQPLKHNTFLIWKDGSVKDFELHAMFKISGGNSGIQYRSKDLGDHVVSGYQADIVDSDPDNYTGILYEEKGRGVLAIRGQKISIDEQGNKNVVGSLGDAAELAKAVKKGDWNDYVITARGNHLTQTINGKTTVDVVDNEASKAAREGILALQIHAGFDMTVQFKEIQLKELKAQEKPQ
jgi:hypothetical protein